MEAKVPPRSHWDKLFGTRDFPLPHSMTPTYETTHLLTPKIKPCSTVTFEPLIMEDGMCFILSLLVAHLLRAPEYMRLRVLREWAEGPKLPGAGFILALRLIRFLGQDYSQVNKCGLNSCLQQGRRAGQKWHRPANSWQRQEGETEEIGGPSPATIWRARSQACSAHPWVMTMTSASGELCTT